MGWYREHYGRPPRPDSAEDQALLHEVQLRLRAQQERGRRGRWRPWDRGWPGGPDTPDGGGLRPPPGWTVRPSYAATQAGPGRAHRRPAPPEPAGITRGVAALPRAPERPAGPRPGTTQQHQHHDQQQQEERSMATTVDLSKPTPSPASAGAGGAAASAPSGGVDSVQYEGESELSIYDVIEADEAMAEEIEGGADHARVVAARCEVLIGHLERMHAEIIALRIPGLLLGWVERLMERAQAVQAAMEAVSEGVPAAAEAIRAAGELAAEVYLPAADITRDQGHAAPAAAGYHED